SNSPPSSYNLESYSQDVITLLNRLNLDAAWLVGHSLGGSVALWAADICPQRIKGVICMNAGGGIYLKEEFERFREAGRQILERRPPWLPSVPFIDLLFSRMMVKQTLSKKWGKQRVIDFVRADYQAALGSLLETTTVSEVHLLPQIVSRLPQPVYFLA
ncbi:MAG: alpha/beta fold hydrolase, partial [Microcystis sp.]